jgi:hypothetical protein
MTSEAGDNPQTLSWRERLEAELANLDPDDETHQSERLIKASAVIQQALDEAGLHMTVVGGSAVTVWRPDEWSSGDIDFVGAAASAQLAAVLEGEFGFERDGRHWIDAALRVFVERPGTQLQPFGAGTVTVPRFGANVRVIAIEDLIIDRVHAWDGSGDTEMWKQAADLLRYPSAVQAKVEEKAVAEDLTEALRCICWLSDNADGLGPHDAKDLYDGYRVTRRFEAGEAAVIAARAAAVERPASDDD